VDQPAGRHRGPYGKGDGRHPVKLSARATAAIVRWDRERTAAVGPPTPARRPTAPCTADERARPVATTPGQIDVDQVLELVEREQEASSEAEMATGELVSAFEPLVAAWAATLADRPQTQRTYGQAVRRFLVWLGPSLATSR
jgi:hypothetical protein